VVYDSGTADLAFNLSLRILHDTMMAIRCEVHGQVQGVRYRAFVEDAATTLGLVGFVRNNPSGTVTVVAHGLPDALKEFIEYLHEGSLQARVESVEVAWEQPTVTYYEFSVLH
jgi:acylphosphatase